jgi:NTE family protein
MSRKRETGDEITKKKNPNGISNQYLLNAYIVPIGTVSEGSRVILDGSQSYYRLSKDLSTELSTSVSRTTRTISGQDNIRYLWTQTDGSSVDLKDNNTATPSFIAPFIEIKRNSSDPKPYATFKFQLILNDKEGSVSEPAFVDIVVKMVQRALVFQGGGALGAYEVGVFKALCENIIEKTKGKQTIENNGNRPVFDIVAGTSIGAVNAAVIVGKVLEYYNNRNDDDNNDKSKSPKPASQVEVWTNTIRDLERLWDDISNPLLTIPTWMRDNPSFQSLWKSVNEFSNSLLTGWWEYLKNVRMILNGNYRLLSKEVQNIGNIKGISSWPDNNGPYIPILREEWPYIHWVGWKENWKEEWPYIQGYFYWPENYGPPATAEAARRNYSYTNSIAFGIPRVLLPAIQQPDMTFFGSPFTRFDNTPLARTIKKYWDYEKFPIKTTFKDLQPRLLLISVDMLDATSAVAFDSYVKENGKCKTEYGDEEFKYAIEYPDGITIEHVMASMSTHLKHRYPEMKVTTNNDGENKDLGNRERGEQTRLFWDGAYLSNTPLKELLHEHEYYWNKIIREKVKLENGQEETIVPDLEIYIINLYPTVENEIPMTADAIQDREIDIKFHDRTKNDIRFAQITSDYLELVEQITNLGLKHAEDDEDFKKDYDALLSKLTRSRKRTGISRTYKDLLEGRYDITRVIYVDRQDDNSTIFGKAFEFSPKTVSQLQKAGYEDAQIALDIESVRSAALNLLDNSILTQQEVISLEQKLQAAIAHAKHQDIDKALERTSELNKTAIAALKGKNLEQKDMIEFLLEMGHLINSAGLLDLQLLISKATVMVNKGIYSQSEGERLKQELVEKKRIMKEQGAPLDIMV